MNPSIPDEADVVRRAAGGETAAFARLHAAYRGHVRRLVRGYVPDADTEDVVQVAFIRAHASLPRFRGDAAFATWLTRIAINAALSHRSGERARRLRESADGAVWMGGAAEGPDEAVERNELSELLRQAIGRLPAPYRQAMWMRYVEDRPYGEIGRALGVPTGTLKTWLHRGRACIVSRIGGRLTAMGRPGFDALRRRLLGRRAPERTSGAPGRASRTDGWIPN